MRWVAVAVAVVAVAAVAILWQQQQRRDSPLDRARHLVGDAANFDTGLEAGETLVAAATELVEHARRCIAEHGETPYCLAFRSAAAWSNVAGTKALTCRAPGRFALRRTTSDFYRRLSALRPDARDIPLTPPLPRCD